MHGKPAFFGIILALCLLTASLDGRAAEPYPAGPVRIVVGYPPGGGNDLVGRLLAKRLSENFGKSVFVDNRPGASTVIGTQFVARSAPDGQTLILADRPLVTNPFIYPDARYDPLKDFEPVSLLGSAPVVLVSFPKAPYQTVSEMVAYAKAEPGKVAMGSGGSGTTTHIAGELFQLRTGIKLNHVPYKGAGPALTDVMGGQIQCIFTPIGPVIPFVTAGRLRALAISTVKRLPSLADVPTFEELGISDYRVSNWYGILAPAGTPKPVVAQLNTAIANALQAQEVKEWYQNSLVIPATSTPEEFAAFMRSEAATWSKVIKAVGIKPE